MYLHSLRAFLEISGRNRSFGRGFPDASDRHGEQLHFFLRAHHSICTGLYGHQNAGEQLAGFLGLSLPLLRQLLNLINRFYHFRRDGSRLGYDTGNSVHGRPRVLRQAAYLLGYNGKTFPMLSGACCFYGGI